jgi:hypothetical protein
MSAELSKMHRDVQSLVYLFVCLFVYPWGAQFRILGIVCWKNAMGAMIIAIIEMDGTHDIHLLSQDARAALNGILSETFCSTNPWGPWHLGRAWAWARAQGCPTGPGTGPELGLGPAQASPGNLEASRNAMGAINLDK